MAKKSSQRKRYKTKKFNLYTHEGLRAYERGYRQFSEFAKHLYHATGDDFFKPTSDEVKKISKNLAQIRKNMHDDFTKYTHKERYDESANKIIIATMDATIPNSLANEWITSLILYDRLMRDIQKEVYLENCTLTDEKNFQYGYLGVLKKDIYEKLQHQLAELGIDVEALKRKRSQKKSQHSDDVVKTNQN